MFACLDISDKKRFSITFVLFTVHLLSHKSSKSTSSLNLWTLSEVGSASERSDYTVVNKTHVIVSMMRQENHPLLNEIIEGGQISSSSAHMTADQGHSSIRSIPPSHDSQQNWKLEKARSSKDKHDQKKRKEKRQA